MKLITKIIKAGNGDAILINFREDEDTISHNILIDGGGKLAYEDNLKLELISLIKSGESLDLLIVTHIDQDHIGGIIQMFDDIKSKNLYWQGMNEQKKYLEIKEIWFNANCLLGQKDFWFSSGTTKVSLKQGADLELYVNKKAEYVNTFVARPEEYKKNAGIAFFGKKREAKITILSPTENYLITYNEKIANDWNKEIKKLLENKHSDYKVGATQARFNKMKIRDLIPIVEKQRMDNSEEKDSSASNLSSIAFLFEFGSKSFLLLGDAHYQTIIKSLKDLSYSKKNPLVVDYVKLSHHGGITNTNYELLELIECKNFIISSNGQNHDLPNKATFAKIISAKGDNVNFFFNYPSEYYPFSFYDEETRQSEIDLHKFYPKFTKETDKALIID